MILEDIVESTKERVETNKKRHSIYELKEKAFAMPIDQSFPFKKALEKVVATKMVLTRRVDMKYLKKYINLANMYKVDCKIVDGLSYVGNISLVVSADDAVDIKRNPIVKSRLEIIKDRGMPLAYYDALGKKVSKRYLKIIKKLLPELLDQYKELTFFDKLCGEKCPLEEKLGGKIYG